MTSRRQIGVINLADGYDESEDDARAGGQKRSLGVDNSYANVGSSMGGVRNTFERQRLRLSSAMTSHFPHVMAQRLPTIGPDSFAQWFSPMYVLVIYILLFAIEGMIYSMVISTAFVTFPGIDPLSILIKAMIAGGTSAFIVIGFSRWTGAYCDPFITTMVGFMEIFFDDKWKDYNSAGIAQKASVIGKIAIACIFNWVGFLIGFALMVASQGGSVTTSDCLVDFTFVCLAQPRPFFIGETTARWQAALGSLLIPGAFLIAYGLNKKRELWTLALTYSGIHYSAVDQNGERDGINADDMKRQKKANKMYVPYEINDDYLQIGATVGLAHFLVVGLFSRNIGFAFNFWYWFVSSIYTGDYEYASIYAWPMLLACIIVFVAHTLWFLMSERSISFRRNKFQELAEENDSIL